MFAYKKKIYKNYYLIGVDTDKNISLCYELSDGGYIGRIPSNVIGYAILDDSLIVAKIEERVGIRYYILNIKNDSKYAEPKSCVIGPLKETKFYKKMNGRKYKFIEVN